MTTNSSKGKTRWLTALVTAFILMAAACGDDTDNNASEATAGGDGSEESADAGGSEDPYSVAFILNGSIEDRGYNADAQATADAVEEQVDGTEVSVTQSVDVANQSDVYRQYAQQDYDLVIGWGGQFTDGAVEVAAEFPDTDFLVVNSGVENGTNLGSMDTAIEQWQYLAGYVTASLSDSDAAGWVGAICFPATAANLSGTEQGMKAADPEIEVLSTFVGDFEDPTAARQAAEAMIDEGAGALTGNLNNGWFGVFDAAKESGTPLVTEWTDNSELAPEVIATSLLKSQARFVVELVEEAKAGEFPATFTMFELPEDWGPAIVDSDALPDGLYEEVLQVQEDIANGTIEVERGESCPNQ